MMEVYESGDKVMNYIITPGTGLNMVNAENVEHVQQATKMSELLVKYKSKNIHMCICRVQDNGKSWSSLNSTPSSSKKAPGTPTGRKRDEIKNMTIEEMEERVKTSLTNRGSEPGMVDNYGAYKFHVEAFNETDDLLEVEQIDTEIRGLRGMYDTYKDTLKEMENHSLEVDADGEMSGEEEETVNPLEVKNKMLKKRNEIIKASRKRRELLKKSAKAQPIDDAWAKRYGYTSQQEAFEKNKEKYGIKPF